MISRRIVLNFLFVMLVLGLTLYSYEGYHSNTTYPESHSIEQSDKVLVVAPHPDDETISSAGVIRYCIEHNIPVEVLVVTNGGDSKSIGTQRHSETLTAMGKLGLKSDKIIFLDYPEGLRFLFNQNWDYKNLYEESDGTSHSRNSFSYDLNAPYCGENLVNELEQVIGDFKPTIIIYPDPNDKNTDHWATSAFINYATTQMNYKCIKYGYLAHAYSLWPYPRGYNPNSYLTPSPELSNEASWITFPLNRYDEALEFLAIKSYKSQITPDSSYLISFVKRNELFSVYPDLNISVQNRSTNFLKGSVFPPTLFNDPENDLMVNDIFNDPENELMANDIRYLNDLNLNNTDSLDLTTVGFEMNKNTTWISLKTRNGISNNTFYEFHLRTFANNGTNRIDIQIMNGRANYQMISQNSVKSNLKIKTIVKHNGIIIGIPSSMINSNQFMINADVSNKQGIVDTTAWRTVDIT